MQDTVGIDVEQLDDIQVRMLQLYSSNPNTPSHTGSEAHMRESIANFCHTQVPHLHSSPESFIYCHQQQATFACGEKAAMCLLQSAVLNLCQTDMGGGAQVHAALTKATGQLLDDLHRNVRLLGTPERSAASGSACLSCCASNAVSPRL